MNHGSFAWLLALVVTLVVGALAFAGGSGAPHEPSRADRVVKTEAEWKAALTESEFHILREKGTEWAFTGEYHDHKKDGVYVCAGCGLPLYDSKAKFDSGTGWPSYFQAVADDRVDRIRDGSLGMVRTELVCARCGGHLGHVFEDGPPPTGERHCINSVSLDFVPRKEAAALEAAPAEAAAKPTSPDASAPHR